MNASVVCGTRTHDRNALNHDRLMRGLGGSWFLLLAINIVWPDSTEATTVQLVAKACQVTLYVLFALLIFTRPRARAQADCLLPRIVAFTGTYMPWTIAFFPRTDPWPALSTVLVAAGLFLAITVVLYLGRAFSIVPEARRVVRTGPYRWVRHPLYLAEELAVLGTLLQFLSPLTLLVFFGHVAVQMYRIHYEEALLQCTFAAYEKYMETSWRLIPFLY